MKHPHLITAVLAALICASAISVRADRYDDLMTSWMNANKTRSAGYTTSTDAMRLAWNCMSAFHGMCYALEITRDADLAATMAADLANVIQQVRTNPNGDDGFLITSADGTFKNTDATWWTDGVEYSGESFRIFYGFLKWIRIVKETPALDAVHGTAADGYLNTLENTLVKKWLDDCWVDDSNDPVTDYHYPGTGMLVQPTCTTHTENPYLRNSVSSANNKLADFGLAMIELYRITGDAKYREYVEEAALEYKSKLWWSDDASYYSWAYQNPYWYMDFTNYRLGTQPRHAVWVEHRSGYGELDMKFMTACYRMGIVYNRTDIDRFVKTNTVVMYNNGDGWLKSDGTEPNTAASESAGPFASLAPYDASGFLADTHYDSYSSGITSFNARCGAPYLVYLMKLAAGELDPPDTMDWVGPLEVTAVEAVNKGTVRLTFYNEVDPSSITDPANFDFSRGIECTHAEMDPSGDAHKVLVHSTEQTAGVTMKIEIRNVKDVYGNETFAFPYANQPYTWTSSDLPVGVGTPDIGTSNRTTSRAWYDMRGNRHTTEPGQPGVYLRQDGTQLKKTMIIK